MARPARRSRIVGRDAGLARLEQDSGARHQPLRALDDTLPSGFADPATRRLWALHRQRLIASLERLRLNAAALRSAAPRPVGAAGGPGAGAGAGAWSMAGASSRRAWRAASPSAAGPPAASLPPTVDLWITPPAYTRRAPLVSEQTRGVRVAGGPVRQRGPGAGPPSAGRGDGRARLRRPDRRRSRRSGPGSGEATLTLDTDAFLAVTDGTGREIARWFVDVIPDAAPIVSFVGEPRATHRSVLRIDLEAQDDYGVAELALLLAPAGRGAELERLPLLKPGNQPAKLASGSYQDLTAHPLAGLPVMLQLEAVDAIGQRGQSGPLGDGAAGARVPPSAGARDHRGAAQAGGARRDQRRRWRSGWRRSATPQPRSSCRSRCRWRCAARRRAWR